MEKIGAFELVSFDREELLPEYPYLVAHFYYGQGAHSEWKYDPVKKIYEHRYGDMFSPMSKPNHTYDTKEEMYYTMKTCIDSCCCPNDKMKKERMEKLVL
jgi:hypothetical protein